MYKDDVQVCAILRNFESDVDYLPFSHDFWIQKITEEDKKQLTDDLNYFHNYPLDNYIVGRWYYIGRGKSTTVLRDNIMMFFFPLFRALKLFKAGELILPVCFYKYNNKWHDTEFCGESYGLYGFDSKKFIFNKSDIEPFINFKNEINTYLKFMNFSLSPYQKKPKILADIDTRCLLAIHIFLKESRENYDPFTIYDRLIGYTIGLESLFLLRRDEDDKKRKDLSSRIAVLLSKNETEETQLIRDIKKYYDIRSDIVHASFLDNKDDNFLRAKIYDYEDILRKSILAFLDLNLNNASKEEVLNLLDKAILDNNYRQEMQKSLKILNMAM